MDSLSANQFNDGGGHDEVDSIESQIDGSNESPVDSDVEDAETEAKQGKTLVSGKSATQSVGSTLKGVGVATSKAITPGAGKKGTAAAADKAAAAKAAEAREAASRTDAFDPAADLPMYREGMDWFVLRVASNKESSVRETLLRKVQIEGMEHLVGRIMVPTEKTKTLKGGKQRVTETKLYPGYVFVEMKLEADGRIPQDVFFLIKETTGVGDFVGTAGRPTPMAPHEVEKMLFDSRRPEETPQVKMEFQKGDSVTIKEGPFQNYEGTVDEVLPEKGLVRVLVTIFGRQAPIELEYWQIAKAQG
jgi:transcription termination/antitermination protein NusG